MAGWRPLSCTQCRSVYLQGLSPLHSLGITPASYPRFIPAEPGISLLSITFLWELLGSMNPILSFDRWGHEGLKREGNLSQATVLVIGRVMMRSHVSYIPIQDVLLQVWVKFNFNPHGGKWEAAQELWKDHSFGGTWVCHLLTLWPWAKHLIFWNITFLMYKNRYNSICLQELLRELD